MSNKWQRRRNSRTAQPRDLWDDPRAKEWFERAQTVLLPKIDASAFVVSINPDQPDAKMAVELGFAILLDKPIVIYSPPDREITEHLRRVADHIVVGDLHDPETKAKMEAVLDSMVKDKD